MEAKIREATPLIIATNGKNPAASSFRPGFSISASPGSAGFLDPACFYLLGLPGHHGILHPSEHLMDFMDGPIGIQTQFINFPEPLHVLVMIICRTITRPVAHTGTITQAGPVSRSISHAGTISRVVRSPVGTAVSVGGGIVVIKIKGSWSRHHKPSFLGKICYPCFILCSPWKNVLAEPEAVPPPFWLPTAKRHKELGLKDTVMVLLPSTYLS